MAISNLWPKHDLQFRFFMLISNKHVKILKMLVMMVFVLLQMGVQSYVKFHLEEGERVLEMLGLFRLLINQLKV